METLISGGIVTLLGDLAMDEKDLENAIHTIEEMLEQLKHRKDAQSMNEPNTQGELDISIEDTYRTTFLFHPELKEWAYAYTESGAVKSLERLGLIAMEYAHENDSSFRQFAIERNNDILKDEFLSDVEDNTGGGSEDSESTEIGVETSQTESKSSESIMNEDDSMESTDEEPESMESEDIEDDKSVDELLEEEFGDGFDT